ncbi:GPP34 family phosphoprotein [Streptomyces sp. NPDC052225]|uniref:GPP34 family phosphoprotein n=1 Tax=Streptomyces sp. NPDC052225 TaxID=3154949 RepID=UPI00342A736C
MTTARDLALLVLDGTVDRHTDPADLSLALAGAEAIDLLELGGLTLDGDSVVPAAPTATGDQLLDAASALLARQYPYETVGDWLWRRGPGLARAYSDELRREGLVTRPQWHRESVDAILEALLAAARIESGDGAAEVDESLLGDAVTTVLAAVGESVTQLEAVRLRRGIENAAFDNVWRA